MRAALPGTCTHACYPIRTDRATLTLVSGKHDDGALSRIAVTRHVVDTTVFLIKPLLLGEDRLCESWVITHMWRFVHTVPAGFGWTVLAPSFLPPPVLEASHVKVHVTIAAAIAAATATVSFASASDPYWPR